MMKAAGLIFLALLLALVAVVASPILTKNPLFLAGLPIAGFCLLLVFLKPDTVFMLILLSRAVLDPILEKTKIGGGAGLGFLLNVFVIMLTGVLISKKTGILKRLGPARYWIPFLGACVISGFTSAERVQAIRLTLNLTTYACMLAAPFLMLNRSSERPKWIKYLLWATYIPVLSTYVGVATKSEMLYFFAADRGAVKGTFSHPNILAFFMVFSATLLIYILRCEPFRLTLAKRMKHAAYLLIVLGALVLTETRSAWIACAVVMGMYALQKERKWLVILALGLGVALALPPIQARIKDLTSESGRKSKELNSMDWRIKLWQSSMPYIARRPLTGYGLGEFQPMSTQFFTLEKKHGAPAHNVYVELLFEVGLLGLLTYVSIYLAILRLFWGYQKKGATESDRRAAFILFWYVVGFMAVSFSDNTLYYLAHNWYFWFFVGLQLRGMELARAEAEPKAVPAPSAA